MLLYNIPLLYIYHCTTHIYTTHQIIAIYHCLYAAIQYTITVYISLYNTYLHDTSNNCDISLVVNNTAIQYTITVYISLYNTYWHDTSNNCDISLFICCLYNIPLLSYISLYNTYLHDKSNNCDISLFICCYTIYHYCLHITVQHIFTRQIK